MQTFMCVGLLNAQYSCILYVFNWVSIEVNGSSSIIHWDFVYLINSQKQVSRSTVGKTEGCYHILRA